MKKTLIIPVLALLFAFAGSASAQTAGPSLLVQLQSAGVAPTISAGASNVTLANVYLDATRSTDDIRLASLPVALTTGNGGVATNLRNCRVVNSLSPGFPLNTGNNVVTSLSSGSNMITFDNAIVIPRGTAMNLLLNCNIDSTLVAGGTYQFSINTSNVAATAVSTGLPAVVGVGGVSAPVVVPGIPNTGAGGAATMNILLIVGSLALVVLGFVYTRKNA